MILHISLLLILSNYRAICAIVSSLTENDEWAIQNSNGSIFVKLSNPSGIYSDLMKTNVIKEDILYGFNDIKYRWIGNDTWTYSVNFTIGEGIKFAQSSELIFYGLDGFATIFLNKKCLGEATNTFVRYRYDVKDCLRKTNLLEIKFQSPIKSGIIRFRNASHLVPPSCVPVTYKGECHVNFLRRMQASFAWDWGPAFPSVGIWKPIELLLRQNDLIIRDIVVTTTSYDDVWRVTANVYSEIPENSENISGHIYLSISASDDPQNKYIISKKITVKSNLAKKEIVTSSTMDIPKRSVKLWWPNGYGDQHLYELSAIFVPSSLQGNSTKTIKIGFRTVQLIQNHIDENDPQKGRSFYFQINGVPVFAKGSNYIPSNILLENSSDENVLEELLESAKISNMNMLRVWGGGIYESDFFYQLCDKYGIMIWQDMMFACNMYPVDDKFLFSVKEEISQQIRRLQYHPSIVIWAGNNENEAALSGNWYNTAFNYSLYKEEYIELYVNIIQDSILKIDNTRTYLTSSPTNGIETLMEDYVAKNPYSPLYGDVHYYNYFKNSWIIDNFPFTRFSSEYGFQSLPSLSTWKKIATREDLFSLNTKFMNHRQHLPLGSLYLIYMLLFHFPIPLLTDMENLIYLSQINQAWSVKSQTEWYRKWRNVTLPDGRGQTMGALYWQLNDIWQAPSWSSIEYGGKWKMLQYYTKHFFAPILVAADLAENRSISINIISDLLYDVPNMSLNIEIFKWDSLVPVDITTEIITVKKESSTIYKQTSVSDLIDSKPQCHADIPGQSCFLKLLLMHKENNSIISENYLFPVSFKTANGIQVVDIQFTVNAIGKNVCRITLTTNAISLFVWLDAGEIKAIFSDNGFMMTQSQKTVEAQLKNSDCSTLENFLKISVLDARTLSKLTNSVSQQFLNTRIFNPFM